MRVSAFLLALLFLTPALAADSRHVEVDDKADFAAFKTFVLREGKATSRKPEINSPLVLKTIEDAIRADLSAKKLNETHDRPDLIVTFSVAEEGQRVVTGRGKLNTQVSNHSVGTLVIDMTTPGSNTLVWHGTYTDDEISAATLAKNLPKDAKKLLSEYPPKKK
jgi:Domain of unknown function (DUF4136)